MEKAKPYAKRNTDLFTQVHLHIPVELNQQLGELASRDGLTRAAWVSTILTRVIENNGKITEAKLDTSKIENEIEVLNNKIENIENKVDTTINLLSGLIAQSSEK